MTGCRCVAKQRSAQISASSRVFRLLSYICVKYADKQFRKMDGSETKYRRVFETPRKRPMLLQIASSNHHRCAPACRRVFTVPDNVRCETHAPFFFALIPGLFSRAFLFFPYHFFSVLLQAFSWKRLPSLLTAAAFAVHSSVIFKIATGHCVSRGKRRWRVWLRPWLYRQVFVHPVTTARSALVIL